MRLEITRRAKLAIRALALLGTWPGRVKAPCQAADPCVLHVACALARNELVAVLQSTPMSGVESVVA